MSFVHTLTGILEGIGTTVGVTLLALLWAVPFAFAFGIAQNFARGAIRLVVTSCIEFWRSSPVIILLFGFYYVLPLAGLQLSALAVSALVLGLNIGGYASQAVRGALQTLPFGQVEAGQSLGLKRWQILVLIELPQALPLMAPSFINNFIQLVKATPLVSLVTLTDLTFRAKEIAQARYAPAETYTALLVAYIMICYPITVVGRRLERKLKIGRQVTHEL